MRGNKLVYQTLGAQGDHPKKWLSWDEEAHLKIILDLQHIDVGAEPLNTSFNCIEDVFPRKPDAIDSRSVVDGEFGNIQRSTTFINPMKTFRKNHDLMARDVVCLEEFAHNFLALPVRIGVGNVKRVDATVIGMFENGEGGVLGGDPWLPVRITEAHAAKYNLRDLET